MQYFTTLDSACLIFFKLKTHFWIVQEYSQLSRADYFNNDKQEIMTTEIKTKKNSFYAIHSGSFLERQTYVHLEVSM